MNAEPQWCCQTCSGYGYLEDYSDGLRQWCNECSGTGVVQ